MGILKRFIKVLVFLKEILKCTKIYIVGSGKRLFIKKNHFMLKISVKRHVLSVLYSKSRDSRAVFKSREK